MQRFYDDEFESISGTFRLADGRAFSAPIFFVALGAGLGLIFAFWARDLISGVAIAYECQLTQRSFRKLGTDEKPIYMIEVSAEGPECAEAMALLARHGSTRDFIFRRWQPPADVEGVDPIEGTFGEPIIPDDTTQP